MTMLCQTRTMQYVSDALFSAFNFFFLCISGRRIGTLGPARGGGWDRKLATGTGSGGAAGRVGLATGRAGVGDRSGSVIPPDRRATSALECSACQAFITVMFMCEMCYML